MNAVARRCAIWAAVLIVVGAVMVVFLPYLSAELADGAVRSSVPSVFAVEIVLTMIRVTAFPTAAALIGAAVVIQTLRPGNRDDDQE